MKKKFNLDNTKYAVTLRIENCTAGDQMCKANQSSRPWLTLRSCASQCFRRAQLDVCHHCQSPDVFRWRQYRLIGLLGKDEHGQCLPDPSFKEDIKAVEAGDWHTCAVNLRKMGCWGLNSNGQTDIPERYKNDVVALAVKNKTTC